jgi:group II intron reverse transcriptase/maturase
MTPKQILGTKAIIKKGPTTLFQSKAQKRTLYSKNRKQKWSNKERRVQILNVGEQPKLINIDGESPPPGTVIKYNERAVYDIIKRGLKFDEKNRCINAFRIASNAGILKMAYNSIKSKPGNMVHGSDKETLDGISRGWFRRVSEALESRTFKFRPSRRVWIPKRPSGLRPLGIGCPRDKIVQQSIRMVMEHVLDPKFLKCSSGFRPKRGCHTALKEIRSWKSVRWLLEGDIKKFFDSIDHKMLEGLLKKHFDDPSLLDCYWKLVKAGYVEWDTRKKKSVLMKSDIGVPQGGILSPLLSNLVLHEFDLYVTKIIEEKKNESIKAPLSLKTREYYKMSSVIHEERKKLEKLKGTGASWKEFKVHRETIKKLIKKNVTSSLVANPKHIRCKYVRYADDWLIGVWGPVKTVKEIKERARVFLQTLKLELSMEKPLITSTITQKAKFLGTYIKVKGQLGGITRKIWTKTHRKQRLLWNETWLSAPITAITERLGEKYFLRKVKGKWKPEFPKKFLVLPIKELIIMYRSILGGYLNYYSFVNNRRNLQCIYYHLKNSLMRVIRSKYSLNWKDLLRKYGKNVSLQIRKRDGEMVVLDFKCPDLSTRPNNFFETSALWKNPLAGKDCKISAIDPMGQGCANCGVQKKYTNASRKAH